MFAERLKDDEQVIRGRRVSWGNGRVEAFVGKIKCHLSVCSFFALLRQRVLLATQEANVLHQT